MFSIILTVILIMPGNTKDVTQSHDMTSLEECMAAAAAWLAQDPHGIAGAVGVAAGCSKTDAEGPKL